MSGDELIIDEGNTRCKVVIFKNDAVVWQDNEASIEAFDWAELDAKRVMFSSSKRSDTPELLLKHYPQIYHWQRGAQLPFGSLYTTPKTLGKDRIANIMAVLSLDKHATARVAIDFGTCITYDVVDEENRFVGGIISPGISMRLQAMHNYTGKLPLVEAAKVDFHWGDSTKKSILAGAVTGAQKEIEGYMDKTEQEFQTVHYYITGGESKYFDFHNKNHTFANRNLTQIGLKEILKYS